VPKFAVLLALPAFKIDGDEIYDKVSGKAVSLPKFEKDGKYALLLAVKEAGGTAVLSKVDGEFVLTVEHSSTEFVENGRQEVNFARALAAVPAANTENLEESILHEINAYRAVITNFRPKWNISK
jgi:hypothetical protein